MLTPCLRIQAENFAPAAALPAFMAIWKWAFGEPPGAAGASDPPSVVVVAPVVADGEAMLATPGAPEVPPHPAATSARAAPAAASVKAIERRRIVAVKG